MKQLLFVKFLGLVEKLTGKKIVYLPKERFANSLTAVKSDAGFWYCGNLADKNDIAYGIWYNGKVKAEGTVLVSKILNRLLSDSSMLAFYDIGANTGYYGILAAYSGKGKIQTYSFEPLAEYNKVQAESLKLNRLEELCKIFNFALGNINSQSEIVLAGSGSSLETNFLADTKNLEKRLISVKRLDDFVAEQNLLPPDFIKIDVESYEYQVFKGAENTIRKALPVIWYESAFCLPKSTDFNPSFKKSQELLKSLGYEVYSFQNGKLAKVSEAEPLLGVDMYLALHATKHLDIKATIE